MFFVGQKVVCVDDGEIAGRPHHVLIERGHVYTITGFSSLGLFLAECDCPKVTGWMRQRFRPVRTTDISVFHKMLAPSPKKRVRA